MQLFKKLPIRWCFYWLLLVCSCQITNGQTTNPIAQLKFEDAEKAYNAGQFQKALEYIEQTEALVGVTSKTLYLKIVTQDKMLEAGQGDGGLKMAIKTNVQNYLKALEDQPIDDKYRNVYEISKKEGQYDALAAQHKNKALTESGKSAGASASGQHSFTITGVGSQSAKAILQAYYEAISGSLRPGDVQTIKIEKKRTFNGHIISKVSLQKALSRFLLVTSYGKTKTKLIYVDGQATIKSASGTIPVRNPKQFENQVSSPEALLHGELPLDLEALDGLQVKAGVFNGEEVDIIEKNDDYFLFSKSTHLLIGRETIPPGWGKSVTRYGGYSNYSGLLLPSTTITQTELPDFGAASQGALAAESPATISESAAEKPLKNKMAIGFSLVDKNAATTKAGTANNQSAIIGLTPKKNKKALGMASASNSLVSAMTSNTSKAGNLSETANNVGAVLARKPRTVTTVITIISVKINEPLNEKDFR